MKLVQYSYVNTWVYDYMQSIMTPGWMSLGSRVRVDVIAEQGEGECDWAEVGGGFVQFFIELFKISH